MVSTVTVNNVLRDYVTNGVPGSGNHEPDKADLRALLSRLETIAGIGAVAVATKAELDAITDKDDATPGFVLGDSTATNNGQYAWDDGGSAWVKLRALPDSATVLQSVSGTNTITASVGTGVDPAVVSLFILVAAATNTGAMTLAVNGGSPQPFRTYAGAEFASGAIVAGRSYLVYDTGSEYRALNDDRILPFQGAYAGGTTYELGDLVESGGSIWYSLQDSNTGNTPTEGAYWTQFLPGTSVADNTITNAKLSAAHSLALSHTVASRTALKALDTARYNVAVLQESGREGVFAWDSSDLSGTLLGAAIASSAVDSTDDVVTSVAHGLTSGKALIATTAVNGLSTNTIYYAIGLRKINYDAESSAFTAGETLTGGTSGATATIVSVTDNGSYGTLLLKNVDGAFQDNETITDGASGSATSDGADAAEPDKFQIATTFANARAGTAFNLTGNTAFSVKEHFDPLQGLYVTADADISGASGAWVRKHSGPTSIKWFGAAGDYNPNTATGTDDTAAIQASVFALSGLTNGGGIFVPFGTYKTTSTIYLKGISEFCGESNQRGSITQFDVGGSSIYAVHTGAGVISLKGASSVSIKNITIEAAQATAPKVGLILGRDAADSAGNHSIESINIRGNYSVSCIYSIASEEVVYNHVYAWLYAESTGFATYYCAERDVFGVDGLITSTNITSHFFGCSFTNSAFDDADPLREPSVIYLDVGSQTGGFSFTSTYLVANEGSYITINNDTATDILGPFVFQGVNGERLGGSGDPTYGLRVISAVGAILRGLTFIGSRVNFLAGATKEAISIDSDITLFNPAININPEEAFPYAIINVDYGKIKGGFFTVGREGHWKTLTLAGAWVNRFGAPYQQAEYKVSPHGEVCLRGELDSGTGLITTLPSEAWPQKTTRVKALSDGGVCIITISETTGQVTLTSGTAAGLNLETISFYRDAV